MTTALSLNYADGSRYGQPHSPKVADHAARAFQALTHMGFGARETRRALDRIRARGDSHLTPQEWLQQRRALLTEPLTSGS